MQFIIPTLAYVALLLLAFRANRDVLSPAKLYMYVLAVSWGAIFYERWSLLTNFSFVMQVLACVPAVFIERGTRRRILYPQKREGFARNRSLRNVHLTVWLTTCIPLACAITLLRYAGGLNGFRAMVAIRAKAFSNLNWLLTGAALLGPLNNLYLSSVLFKHASLQKNVLYILHFSLTLTVLFFCGGRAGLIQVLLVSICLYHYICRRVSLLSLITFAGVCLAAIGFIGAYRLMQRSEFFSSSLTNTEIQGATSFTEYGPEAVELVARQPYFSPALGYTYYAAVSTFVPRAWWPDKPDTGGRLFTLEFLGDVNHGIYNVNPCILAECMFNFGIAAGLPLGILVQAVVLFSLSVKYTRIRTRWELYCQPSTATLFLFTVTSVAESTFAEFSGLLGNLLVISVCVAPFYYLERVGWLRTAVHRVSRSTLVSAKGAMTPPIGFRSR